MTDPLHAAPASNAARGAQWSFVLLVVAFAVPAIFAGSFGASPRLTVLALFVTVVVVAQAFARTHGIPWTLGMLHRAGWGLLGAAGAGAFTAAQVLGQPFSSGPGGLEQVFDVLWLGVIYGGTDAMLLTILPITLVRVNWPLPTGSSWRRTAVAWLYALALSMAVTALYHLGYPEFRGAALAGPLIGGLVFAAAQLLTGSPLAPLLAHIAMHVAAVLHGYSTALQLPPHY